MTAITSELLRRFDGVGVLVIGEAMLDRYIEGSSERLSQEAPVPVVDVESERDVPGGAANAAANVAALGASATLVSVVGDDEGGARLVSTLEARAFSTDGVLVEPNRRTLSKQRVLSDGHMMVRFDCGDKSPIDQAVEDRIVNLLEATYAHWDAVLICDYAYGVLTPRIHRVLATLQRRTPQLLVVDAKDPAAYRNVRPSVLKPNYRQALMLLGEMDVPGRSRPERVVHRGDDLLRASGADIVAVTLDSDGAVVFERDRPPYRTYARPHSNARASGAGDTFAASMTVALAAGAGTPAAAEVASAAAAVVLGKVGTATCSRRELRARLVGGDKHVRERTKLSEIVEYHRNQGRRVVFTNGCFDILHRGHVTYLNRAKALGDVLVVGVNSDLSTARLKGAGRPVNALGDRIEILSALSCVDHIASFDEDTPVELIRAIRPDVFVKGGDYTKEMLVEAPVVESLGGVVHILPYIEDRSTTGIIDRIRESAAARRT